MQALVTDHTSSHQTEITGNCCVSVSLRVTRLWSGVRDPGLPAQLQTGLSGAQQHSQARQQRN